MSSVLQVIFDHWLGRSRGSYPSRSWLVLATGLHLGAETNAFMWISGCLCYAGKFSNRSDRSTDAVAEAMTRFGAAKHAAHRSDVRAFRAIPAKHPHGRFASSTSRVSDSTSRYSRWPLNVSFIDCPRTTTLRCHTGNWRAIPTTLLVLALFVPALFAQTQTQPIDVQASAASSGSPASG